MNWTLEAIKKTTSGNSKKKKDLKSGLFHGKCIFSAWSTIRPVLNT